MASRNRTWSCLVKPDAPPVEGPLYQTDQSDSSGEPMIGVRVHQNGIVHVKALVPPAMLGQFLAMLAQTIPELLQSTVHIDLVLVQVEGSEPTAPT